MTVKKTANKTKLATFRIDIETNKKLNEVAEYKKMNRTDVVKDLIRLAHIGIFSAEAKKLNSYFKKMIVSEKDLKKKSVK